MTEPNAINETRRRVEQLRAGITTLGVPRARTAKPVKGSTYVRSSKIFPRGYA